MNIYLCRPIFNVKSWRDTASETRFETIKQRFICALNPCKWSSCVLKNTNTLI